MEKTYISPEAEVVNLNITDETNSFDDTAERMNTSVIDA